MNKFWDDVIGQEEAVQQLRSASESGALSHAYLFVGAQGLGKTDAARAMAAYEFCGQGGCKQCSACTRLSRDTHPDFVLVEPAGPQYSVDQIRTLIHDASLAPAEGGHKFYVIYAVDLFNEASANAFLKTLEEPNPRVTFILITHNMQGVLPTIVSRCIVVRFKTLPQSVMVEKLIERTACSKDDALIALGACGSVLANATRFLLSPQMRATRNEVVRTFRSLKDTDDLEVIDAVSAVLTAMKGPLADMAKKQEEELKERAELLDPKASKQLAERNKRRLSAYEKQSINEVLNVFQSLLRDTLCISQGARALVLNRDEVDYLAELSRTLQPVKVHDALRFIDEARSRVALNLDTPFVLETMLFRIREVL